MTQPSITTSWMWQSSSGGVNGALIDTDDHTIQWFDDTAGCGCAESIGTQTVAQYRERGALVSMPEDVRAELEASLNALMHPQP